MSREYSTGCGLEEVLRDPLIRLVMVSDGVSETELVALMERVRRSLRGRETHAPAGRQGQPVLLARRQGGGRETLTRFPVPAERAPRPPGAPGRRVGRMPGNAGPAGRRGPSSPTP